MLEWMTGVLTGWGVEQRLAGWLAMLAGALLLFVVAFIANVVAKRIIVTVVARIIRKTSTQRDDVFLRRKVFTRLSHIAPAVAIYLLAPVVFAPLPALVAVLQDASVVYMVVIVVVAISSLLNAGLDIYRTFEISRRVPIRAFVQAIKVIVILMGGIVILSVLTQRTPWVLLGGLGAVTAVLLLVFKDSILGFVAGIQLTANDMVRRGDWIEMPRFGADGDVLDVALTTVKVRNFDNTITTIPTYALIAESFKNWRGMSESEGRRIKRALHIDMTTVRFCDEEMLGRFAKIQHIRPYLERKKEELARHNEEMEIDDASLINGRRLTNLGTFRAYAEAYLRSHPEVNAGLTCMVRQLAPTEHGLPLEVYAFTGDKRWVEYERIQADIFDHLVSAVPEFDLRVFQDPTGADLGRLGS
jgi:miniconductance mechanosensitive channel